MGLSRDLSPRISSGLSKQISQKSHPSDFGLDWQGKLLGFGGDRGGTGSGLRVRVRVPVLFQHPELPAILNGGPDRNATYLLYKPKPLDWEPVPGDLPMCLAPNLSDSHRKSH